MRIICLFLLMSVSLSVHAKISLDSACPLFMNCCGKVIWENHTPSCDGTVCDSLTQECTVIGCCPKGADVNPDYPSVGCCLGTIYTYTDIDFEEETATCCPKVDPSTGEVNEEDATKNTESAAGIDDWGECCYGTLYQKNGSTLCCPKPKVINNNSSDICVRQFIYYPYDSANQSCWARDWIDTRAEYEDAKDGTCTYPKNSSDGISRKCEIWDEDFSNGGSGCMGTWKGTESKTCVPPGAEFEEYTYTWEDFDTDEKETSVKTITCGSDCDQSMKIIPDTHKSYWGDVGEDLYSTSSDKQCSHNAIICDCVGSYKNCTGQGGTVDVDTMETWEYTHYIPDDGTKKCSDYDFNEYDTSCTGYDDDEWVSNDYYEYSCTQRS